VKQSELSDYGKQNNSQFNFVKEAAIVHDFVSNSIGFCLVSAGHDYGKWRIRSSVL
jgi:hypothetical protein